MPKFYLVQIYVQITKIPLYIITGHYRERERERERDKGTERFLLERDEEEDRDREQPLTITDLSRTLMHSSKP